jgi:GDP-L-fucose synthase
MKAIMGSEIHLKQDCKFSWVDIDDVIEFVRYAFGHELKYHDYNLAYSQPFLISEMARMINEIDGRNHPVIFDKPGQNLEYTASNKRWMNEYDFQLTPIKASLRKVYSSMKEIAKAGSVSDIDERWK